MPPPPPLGVALRSGTADRVDISSPPVCWRSGTPSERAVSDRLQLSADHRKRKWAQRGGKWRLSWDSLILVTFSCIRQASVLRTAGSLGEKMAFRDSTSKVNQNEYSPLPKHPPSTQNLPAKGKSKHTQGRGNMWRLPTWEFHPTALEQQETFRNLRLLTA